MQQEYKKIKKYFKSDFYRMTGKKSKNIFYILYHFLGEFRIRYVFYLRWLQSHTKKNVFYPMFYALKILSGRRHGLEISHLATIGPGLYLGHPYNITVGGGG